MNYRHAAILLITHAEASSAQVSAVSWQRNFRGLFCPLLSCARQPSGNPPGSDAWSVAAAGVRVLPTATVERSVLLPAQVVGVVSELAAVVPVPHTKPAERR